MGMIPEQSRLRQDIIDFIQFEEETWLIWPWAISARFLLRNENVLSKIADAVRFGETGCYDTDDLYEAISKVTGNNPAL